MISLQNDFIKKHKTCIFILIAIIVITYGIKMYNLSISIDNEAAIVNADSIYSAWNTMGRIGLTFLKKIFGVYVYNPYLAISLMMVFLLISCVIFGILFEYIKKDLNTVSFLVFSALFVTAPILAEQLGFVMQSVEVLIGFCLIGLGTLLFYMNLEEFSFIKSISIVLLLGFSFSIYQALIPLFVSVAIATVILYSRENVPNFKECFIIIVKLIIVFIVSLIIYYIGCELFFKFSNISRTNYTSGQVKWQVNGIIGTLKNMKAYLKISYLAMKIFYNYNLLICTILIIIYGFRCLIEKKYNIFYYIALISLLISPFFMGIILGDIPQVRTELCKVFSIAFMNMFLFEIIFNKKQLIKKYLIVAIVSITFINQLVTTSRLYYTEYITNLEQYSIAMKISNEIEKLGGNYSTNKNVLFVGKLKLNRNNSCYSTKELEMVGYSHFEISFSPSHGSYLMNMYMQTLGYKYYVPSNDQIKNLKKYYENMPVWPSEGSIQKVDDCFIVKLSNKYAN